MKAIFLDKNTFSDQVNLSPASLITEYQTFASTPQDDDVIVERCHDADIILTNKVQLNAKVLQQLPKLKLIQLTATGTNNVDKPACDKLGISLLNVAGYAVKSVPEHTFMLMLNAMRAGIHYHQATTNGMWQQTNKFCLIDQPLMDLENKTLGIIGVGTIGKRVGQIANAFGMKVLWAEHQNKPARNADYTAFDTVLETSDIISLHCPLTPETHHVINPSTIKKMHKKPLIVNVARGDVVDGKAIVDAINNELLLGYASDVFEQEPIASSNPLFGLANHPRVIFSPHNAWGSLAAQQNLWDIACQQVNNFIAQQNDT